MSLAQRAIEQTDPRGPYIITNSGAKFFIDEVNVEDVPIEDIAHALAYNVRFNGHIDAFYSVAEHSMNVAEMAEAAVAHRPYKVSRSVVALCGLLHDASEAFVPDIPRPFKHLLGGFEEYEDKIGKALAEQHGLPWPFPEVVGYVDKHIVGYEATRLFHSPPEWADVYEDVSHLAKKADIELSTFRRPEPVDTKADFLLMYDRLVREVNRERGE